MTETLAKIVANRLRAGALVVVVQDPDEALALAEVRAACEAYAPITVLSAADENAQSAVEELPSGRGTLILCDFLGCYGENPIIARLVRQVALQQRGEGEAYARLVLVERADAKVPIALASDVEVVRPSLPSVEDLQEELAGFIEAQGTEPPENGEAYALAAAGAGLSRHEFARLLARSVIDRGALDAEYIRTEKARRVAIKLGGALTFESSESADVGGLANARVWAETRFTAFASKEARAFGLPEPKGVLFVGVPGNGKSLFAKMIARQWGLPLLRLDVGRMFGSLVGQSESQTDRAIEAAEACAPCVLWIDEIEKALAGGGSGSSTDSGTTQRVFGKLLTWMQEKTSPVFVVATANRVESIPPELLRKGRFDEIFTVGLPSFAEREEIARIHLARRKREGIDTAAATHIARHTEGFVGAEIEQAIIDGMFAAFAEGREVTVSDITDAADATTPLSKTAADDIKRIEAWAKGRARPASKEDAPTPSARRRGPIPEV